MLFEKMVQQYFPDFEDYEESPEGRSISFKLEDSDWQDNPDFEPRLLELSHVLQPDLITHQAKQRDNAGCGDPECCGAYHIYTEVFVHFVGVRFSEDDSENLNAEIKKLPDAQLP